MNIASKIISLFSTVNDLKKPNIYIIYIVYSAMLFIYAYFLKKVHPCLIYNQ